MSRKRGLNFPYTCPTIDKALQSIDRIIDKELEAFSEEYNIIPTAKSLYGEIESIFEDVRTTNIEIRDAADSQISQLEDEIYDLQDEVNTLSARVEELEKELDLALREDR